MPDDLSTADATPMSLLAHHGEKVFCEALGSDGQTRTVTYADQRERAKRAATVLQSAGVRRGDLVHVNVGNRLEFFDLWLGAGWLGAAVVPTNPQASPAELDYVVSDAKTVLSVLENDVPGLSGPSVFIDGPAGFGHQTKTAAGCAVPDMPVGGPEDIAAVLYTSGTTSRPKGVMITHRNYVAVGDAVARQLHVHRQDRWLVVLPLFHANAQYYPVMSAMVAGASVILAPRFSASSWLQQAAEHRATLGSLFAAPIRMILKHPAPAVLPQMRAVLFAQNLTDEQARDFEERCGGRLLQLWGMTETVLPPTMNPDSAERRWDSIGRSLPGVEVQLLDEHGRPVPAGAVGELHVAGERGRTVSAGYLHLPEQTAQTFRDGLLRTGDLAKVDADGFYYFVDRSKDMIKRSGENVAASEVERVLLNHPAVAECAVVGVADPVRDEEIVAFIVSNAADPVQHKELSRWAHQHLAPFKVPSRFIPIADLPRTSVGKVLKEQLRESASHQTSAADPPRPPQPTPAPEESTP